MNILVKFPTLNRTTQFFNTLYKYYKMAENLDNMKFVITIDESDHSMNNEKVLNGLKTYPNLECHIGTSKSKIDAINRDLDKIHNWDILLLASDDMIPQVLGYDEIIRNDMKKYYSDLDGILWYNDGHQKNNLNTLSILGKKYFDRFKYIYYPEYKSEWADNEFTRVGNLLKRQTYIDNVIIEHQHPNWGYGQNDHIHFDNYKNSSFDKSIFEFRVKTNFNL
jgi:hypothetical protein